MFAQFLLEGVREKTSSKGSAYAEVFVKGVDEDGNPDIVQHRFMTFDEEVLSKLRTKKTNDYVNLQLEIREATITGVGV